MMGDIMMCIHPVQDIRYDGRYYDVYTSNPGH